MGPFGMSRGRDWSERHVACPPTHMKRDLATTVRMLEAAGLPVHVRRGHGRLQVSLAAPTPERPLYQASFSARDGESAADWLVARVFDLYPHCELAKLWRTIAAAAAVAAQGEY
jgi:hypothetical protein